MRTDTKSAASAIFAANRARGAVTFDVHLLEGVTRRRHLHESGSLRVRFPSPEAEGLSAVFVNTPGGVARGGRFDIEIPTRGGSPPSGVPPPARTLFLNPRPPPPPPPAFS